MESDLAWSLLKICVKSLTVKKLDLPESENDLKKDFDVRRFHDALKIETFNIITKLQASLIVLKGRV